ncbi:hypothetical protein B0H11DRAFT_393130 [Mycena galericulata]|nr:hypothetical protein B0H11DRAFT_393130 [Mycena galericulata]
MTGIGSGRRGTSGLAVEEGGGDRQSTVSEDIGLAYMNMGDPPEENEREREARLSKHVRFGDEDSFVEPEPPYMKREPSSASAGSRTRRVPPPTMDPVEDERALNAAAAREVSRELDALNFSAPPLPQVQVQEEGGGWEYSSAGKEQSPSRELPAKREYGSPPKRDYAPSPQSQYATPTGPSPAPFTSPPPPAKESSYAPPPNREPPPLIPPVAPFSRKDSTPGHQSTPSWDASPVPPPAQPAPFVAGHHTTPSWALTPAPPADSPVSPSSPRLETPYRAPIAARSTSSLNTQPPPGARTISAAAFRRPQKAPSSGDLVADTSPLSLKKAAAGEPVPAAAHGVDVAGRVAAAGRGAAFAPPAAAAASTGTGRRRAI